MNATLAPSAVQPVSDRAPGRIALFLPSLLGGGAERVMLELAGGMAEAGYAVDLVLVKAEGPYLKQLPPGVGVVDLGARRSATSLLALVRYLRRVRPTALLSTLGHTNLIAILARAWAGVPLRLAIRETNTPSPTGPRLERLSARAIPWLTRHLYPRADAVIAPSQGVADSLSARLRLPPDRLEVIYNPVLTSRLFERAKEDLEHPWFAPGQPPVVLGVGRLSEQKDFATLLRAFAMVRAARPARLMILGEGEERSRLEALAAELNLSGAVALPGFVDNPFSYMARAALFVLSSTYEGLPNVLIQAMALGAPVVATDCESGPREILENGRYGPLVTIGDARALAAAIASNLDLPRRTPDAAWMARYRVDVIARQYLHTLGLEETVNEFA